MRIVFTHSPPAFTLRAPAGPGLLLALALALLATGCGEHLVKIDSSVLRLRVTEFSITPQLVQVHAGHLKIIAVNTGILTHNVRVESERPNRAGNPIVLGGTGVAQPGDRVESCAVPTPASSCPKLDLKPGRYRLLDTIANHADLGDYATLIVK